MSNRVPEYEVAIRLKLYREGKSDGYIAKIVGTSSQNIYSWRKRNKLPANFTLSNIRTKELIY